MVNGKTQEAWLLGGWFCWKEAKPIKNAEVLKRLGTPKEIFR